MNYTREKKFFFITTYDNISAEIMNVLLNTHPDFRCLLNQSSTLLPTIHSQPLDEYISRAKETIFAGDIKSFTAFSFELARRKSHIQDDMQVVNVAMPLSLRVKLLMCSWLNTGLSEENIYQTLTNELQQQPVTDLINQYNFSVIYKTILINIEKYIEANTQEKSDHLTSFRAKIFYIALALAISFDEMDSKVAKQDIAFNSLLKNPEHFFNILNTLSEQPINLSPDYKQTIISLINNFNQTINHINQAEFLPWQNNLIRWYYNNDLNKVLRIHAIQSTFLSLIYSINALKNKYEDERFNIANNQFLLKKNNIHYELILLHSPMQMRNKNILLPRSVMLSIHNPHTRFLYDLSSEAVTFGKGNEEDWLTMHDILKEAGIPADKIYFICSNYNVKKYYSKWAEKNNIHYRFNVFGNHYWPLKRICELVSNKEFHKIKYQLIEAAKKTVDKNIYRPYYFMCLNSRTRLIRTALLLFLLQRNYFSKGIITYLGRRYNMFSSETKISEQHDPYFTTDQVKHFFNQLPDGKSLLQYSQQLDQLTPLTYDIKADQPLDGDWPLKQLIPELGKYDAVEQFESYFEIVTETYFLNDETLNITEKTIKPILRFQLFIVVGSPHTLSTLQELGFQTFSPYIDETYDTLIDPLQRFISILKEIDRLCSLSREELHKLYCLLWPRILHNYNHLTQNAYELLTGETNKLLQEFI